jgi:hypothetical protein
MKQGISFIFLLPMLFSAAIAQEKEADNMDILVQKLRADKKLLVAENMSLTESEAKAFWPVYEEYQKEMEGMQGKVGDLVERYAENYQKMTDEEAKGLLEDYMSMEGKHLDMRKAFLPKFRAVLPEVKVVRYYQIENKIRAALNYELAALIPLMK